MSKGRGIAPRKTSPKVSLRDQASESGEVGGGNISGTRQSIACWTFSLVEPTPAASQSKAGMRVFGSAQNTRVLILADLGLLGFAPSQESAEIIAALDGHISELSGQIESVSDIGLDVVVTICLY